MLALVPISLFNAGEELASTGTTTNDAFAGESDEELLSDEDEGYQDEKPEDTEQRSGRSSPEEFNEKQ